MPKPRVLVVYKESTYSRYSSSENLVRGFKKNKYWKVLRKSHERHNRTLSGVRNCLRSRGFEVTTVLRSRVQHLGNVDKRFRFVVSVGGDGTFLEASHHVKKIPIFGVNSDPGQSVARLSGSRLENFPKTLDGYLKGRIKPVLVSRLEFFINGKKSPWLALNDLLICTLNPAGTSRYILRTKVWAEEQMSSGLWIGTAAGSTAALLSAGGKVLPIAAKKFQFVSREVYQRKFGSRKHLREILDRDRTLEVISYMRQGRIFVDGPNLVVTFRVGDRLKTRLSKRSLKIIGLKN